MHEGKYYVGLVTVVGWRKCTKSNHDICVSAEKKFWLHRIMYERASKKKSKTVVLVVW